MATTASPLSPTAIAGPSASSPSASRDPQRASRPPQPRPTTYSGLPPTTASAQVPYQTSPSQVPVSIPPRTSSQRQGPPMGPTAAEPRAERSRSAGERGPVSSERRSDRDRDREREREATDGGRTRRAPSAATAAPAAAADSAQRRNSTSQREESSRRNTTGTTAPAQANGTRPDTNSSRGTSRTAAPEGERRETTRGRKETRFGDYILGQTLGEGEFGKVKLGWRRDGGVQVAIKLIRRDTLAPHPSRLSKIYREISILRTLSHPNIVRLHEMVETERHIGIILEYASGGELFDFILTHRFLKDPPACRLFAQLVSGVGYLHKKGIVHRDLKLENLLLDRNRNIIITDFGFANVFDPSDELGEELESKLGEPEILKELEKGVAKKDENTGGIWDELGLKGGIRRRGDLMATSCGSPCYAAPELVVSDGLYTGRKVDVWSCGVILYAMLAGYLPFDDDPANPEGDNINLLYKYIVSTPLTFPEYVSPHARDLLRRILVPDPRKRADLFEVARHSWLSPFANVVGLITSSTTSEKEISNTTVGDELNGEVPLLTRSASVREPSTTNSAHPHATTLGGRHGGHHEHTAQPTQQKVAVDNKRRTVQVEYVAPNSQTKRGDQQGAEASRASNDAGRHNNSRDRPATKDLVVPKPDSALARAATTAGVNTRQSTHADNGRPPTAGEGSSRLPVPQSKTRPASYQYQQAHATQTPASTANAKEVQIPQRRPSTKGRDGPVPVQSKTLPQLQQPVTSNARPGTGGSSTGTSNRLPSRGGSYSRGSAPAAAPSVTTAANAQGKLQQPQSGKPYVISNPIPIPDNTEQISSIGTPSTQPMPAKYRPSTQEALAQKDRGHKRANTVTGTSGGVLSRLMGGSGASRESSQEKSPRASIDQGINNTLNVKPQPPAKSRRFSLLPPSFSLRGIGSGDKKGHERRPSRSASGNSVQQRRWDNQQQNPQVVGGGSSYPQLGVPSSRPAHNGSLSGSEASLAVASAPGTATQPNFPQSSHTPSPEQIPASGNHTGTTPTPGTIPSRPSEEARKRPAVLQKNRKFTEAYEMDGAGAASSGSSGAARRVMDFFRRRGVNRNK
ncbi:hypothetical protein DFH27DRAFT_612617 [Peziza echinospora]|nr:hypothetical protein DFH27DRAFT_612617 [Peziza echinospora]